VYKDTFLKLIKLIVSYLKTGT